MTYCDSTQWNMEKTRGKKKQGAREKIKEILHSEEGLLRVTGNSQAQQTGLAQQCH